MRKFASDVLTAWAERREKSSGRCYTDGTTVYAFSTPVATRALDGKRYIVAYAQGDAAAHLIGCLRARYPRAIIVAKIDTFYSSIYTPTIHYQPRRAAHKVRVGWPPGKVGAS